MSPRRPAPLDVDAPLRSGTVDVAEGRVLEVAEFGDPDGRPVLWLHGTPGSCRQVAPAAKVSASERGVRIIGVARPGVGRSTIHRHDRVLDVADDIATLADRLRLSEYAVIGLSGGGPYALAVAARGTGRVRGAGIMGGVAPTRGPDAAPGGLLALTATFHPLLRRVEAPAAWALTRVLRPLIPYGSPVYEIFSGLMPEADREVFAQPGVKDMFIDDLARGLQGFGMRAALHDAVLFGRDWGFRLADVSVRVHWWHGDADTLVPIDHGRHAAQRLPRGTFVEQHGHSHLSGYAAADEVVATLAGFFA